MTSDPLSAASHPVLQRRLAAVIYNPQSGSGKAKRTANAVCDKLKVHGIEVVLRASSREYEANEIDTFLKQFDFVMVAGGDGTMMGLLQPLARAGTPVFMLPSGNESLFARVFRMRSRADSVLAALRKPLLSRHHFGLVNGRPFFTMMSLGYDSEVIRYIDSYRRGPIRHAGYILPGLYCLFHHCSPQITLRADGIPVLEAQKGYLIIANNKEYAGKLGLVPEADSRHDLLHARFFPGHNRLNVIRWLIKIALGRKVNLAGTRLFQAKEFELQNTNGDYPMQADGESVGMSPAVVNISQKQICVLHQAG